MRICFISKYPPIEGGVSSSAYWLAKGLGEKGHEVHIITNALEVENEYRENMDEKDPNYSPKNVHIHSTDPSPTVEANPSHIPFSKVYCEKLASLAIEVIEEHNLEVIDSWYLIPYCVSGFLAKSFTNVPQIIRHAGSDLQRLYQSPYLNNLLDKILGNADAIITNNTNVNFFQNMEIQSSKIIPMQKTPVFTQAFNPNIKPLDLSQYITNQKYFPGIPIIVYIGKITYHFESKGLCELLDACSKIEDDFILLFIANGNKLDEFKQLVKNANLEKKIIFLNFVPPWKVPSILKVCTCVVALEKDTSPIFGYHTPSIPEEALTTGRCVLMSTSLYKKEPYNHLKSGKDLYAVDPNDSEKIRDILVKIIKNPDVANDCGDNGYKNILHHENFNEYLDKIIGLYKLVSNNRLED